MSNILIIRHATRVICLVFCLNLIGCGDYDSTLSDADRVLYDRFVAADVAALDEPGFEELLKLRKELTTGTAAMGMSGDETEKATVQIEAMMTRLEAEIVSATEKKVKQAKGRALYDLKKAIGRGGA